MVKVKQVVLVFIAIITAVLDHRVAWRQDEDTDTW